MALLSDAAHVLTDLSAQALSLLALHFAARPADRRRTFGYYRLEILAALANGTLLILLSVVLIAQASHRLQSPHAVHAQLVIPVALAGLIANGAGAWLLHGSESLNVRGAYLHVLSDLAALVAVLGGAILMYFKPGLTFIDPLLGIAIALAVVWSAVRLVREATDVLLEAVPSGIDLEAVREDVRKLPGIEDVHDLHIWTITSGLHALSAHIVVRRGTTLMSDNDELLKSVKSLLLQNHRIAHSTLQIESQDYEHVMSLR
jgi:cobalt-zinc-cadmium efflux system protein